MNCFRPLLLLFLLTALASIARGSHGHTWLPSQSPLGAEHDFKKALAGAGSFVALAEGPEEQTTLVHSVDGEHWETVAVPSGVTVRDIAFGAETFVAVGKWQHSEIPYLDLGIAMVSENGRKWSVLDHFPASDRDPVEVGYVKDRFWMRCGDESASVYFSENGRHWVAQELSVPHAVPVAFGERLLFNFRNALVSGEWEEAGGVRITGSEYLVGGVIGLAVGTSRVLALVKAKNRDEYSFAVSGDGGLWARFEDERLFRDVASAGGRFWAIGATGDTMFSSGDGVRWADRSKGLALADASVRAIAAGEEMLIAVGDDGKIFHRPAALAPAIISQPPSAVSVHTGHPLKLAVEAEAPGRTSVVWRRNGQAVPGQNELPLRIESVTAENAGSYTVELTNDAGTVASEPVEVTVGERSEEPVPWESVGEFEGHFTWVAAGDGKVFALSRGYGEFLPALSAATTGASSRPAAWSGDGVYWHRMHVEAPSSDQNWLAAGYTEGFFWMAGWGGIALSRDGIAWREVVLPETARVTHVVRYREEFWAIGGSTGWSSPDGEEWTERKDWGRWAFAGGFVPGDDEFYVASVLGISREKHTQDGLISTRVVPGSLRFQPRLVKNGEVLLGFTRNEGLFPLLRSVDGDVWTSIDALRGVRDLIANRGSFVAVGREMFATSTDGKWWAQRGESLEGIVLNACAAADGWLYAVGDEGKILRRPARLEPAFSLPPRHERQSHGQPARLTAEATGTSASSYQWYYYDEPIDGATGPVLEFDPFLGPKSGPYSVVATNAMGAVRSDLVPVVHYSAADPWQEIGEIPSGVEATSFVTGNGVMLGIDGDQKTIVASREGREWVRTSVSGFTGGVRFAGGTFFATIGPDYAISEDGFTWTRLKYLADIGPLPGSDIAYGNGAYVFGNFNPVGPAYWRSNLDPCGEEQACWHETEGGGFQLAFGNDRFVGTLGASQIRFSEDGATWEMAELPEPERDWDSRDGALAFGNDAFVHYAGGQLQEIFRSTDGEHWEGPWESPVLDQLVFQGGNFWRVDDNNWLSASRDGRRWVNRTENLRVYLDEGNLRLVGADDVYVTVVLGNRVFRRSALLEPVFYASAPGPHPFPVHLDTVVYPGEKLLLEVPAFHGDEAEFSWFDGEEFHEGRVLEVASVTAADAGQYRLTAFNASGSATIYFDVHVVGSYDDWAQTYSNVSREPGEDSGGVGIPNLLRYALHLDPDQPERSKLPQMEWVEREGQAFPALRFQLLNAVDDFDWSLQASSDLVEWTDLEHGVVEASEASGRVREILARDSVSVAEGERRFLRLHVERLGEE